MRTLSSADIVRVWEQGLQQPRWRLGGLLLAPALPDRTTQELLALPLGARNEYLFAVHRKLFGDRLNLTVSCPACAQRLEFPLDATAVCPDAPGRSPLPETILAIDEWRIAVRPLATLDLAAIAHTRSLESATRILRTRSVVWAQRDGLDVDPDLVPDALFAAIAERLPEIDPHAQIQLSLRCPDCDAAWLSLLDIAALLWEAIAVHARHVMAEVHAIATAYGWSEPEILALSPHRRKYYLELVL